MILTRTDVNRLKAEAEAAQTTADAASVAAEQAEIEANADIADANKAAAAAASKVVAELAIAKAAEAWRLWNKAEHSVPEVVPSDWRVITLGLYLILMLLGVVYILSLLAMAVPPEKATGNLRTSCCPANTDCATPNPTSAPTSTPTPDSSPKPSPTPTSTPAESPTASSAGGQTAAPTPAKTPLPANTNSNSNPAAAKKDDEAQEILIPSIVCIQYVGRTSADGYLFLVVLFAGMVGAGTRLVFSFVRHQGIRDFGMSWAWFYLFTPFSGAAISLFLYFVIRGGFYGSAVGKPLALNVFAFFALGTLSGLFAENAMQKLREVAEVLFVKVPEKSQNPKTDGD